MDIATPRLHNTWLDVEVLFGVVGALDNTRSSWQIVGKLAPATILCTAPPSKTNSGRPVACLLTSIEHLIQYRHLLSGSSLTIKVLGLLTGVTGSSRVACDVGGARGRATSIGGGAAAGAAGGCGGVSRASAVKSHSILTAISCSLILHSFYHG